MLSGCDRAGSVFEALEARSLLGAHLVTTLGAVTEGRDGRLTVVATINNTGDRFYSGGDSIFFFLTADTASPDQYRRSAGDFAETLGTRRLPSIAAHGRARIAFTFNRPAVHLAGQGVPAAPYGTGPNLPLVPGGYHVNTDLDLRAFPNSVTRGLRAVSPTEVVIDGRFGQVRGGNRTLTVGLGQTSIPDAYRNSSELLFYYLLSLHDTIATMHIDGPGWGEISLDPRTLHFTVNLHGTTSASTLTLGAPRGSQSSFWDLIINGSVGTLRLDHAGLGGDVRINGSVRNLDMTGAPAHQPLNSTITVPLLTLTANGSVGELKMADLYQTAIRLNGTRSTTIHAGNLSDVSIEAQGGIIALDVRSWTDGSLGSKLRADWVGKLSSGGDLRAAMTLSGEGAPGGVALKEASVRGYADGGAISGGWNITGNVGDISVGGVARLLNIAGNLGRLRVEHDMQFVTLAARNIGALDFQGGGNVFVFAGAYLGRSPSGNDPGMPRSFGVGTIGSISVHGDLWGMVTAGAIPQDPDLFDGWFHADLQALWPGGRIGAITVSGRATPVSTHPLFAAATLPATAQIGGHAIATAADPRFASTV